MRTVIWVLMILMGAVSASAQTEAPAPARGLFNSIFRYTPPELLSLGPRPEDTLDSRVRDGRLELSETDVARLALENNVDIQVERYASYYNLWAIEKSRGILNPSITFSTTTSHKVDPAISVLSAGGADSTITTTSDYDVTFRKPFQQGLDLAASFTTERLRTNNSFYTFNPSLTSGFSFGLTQHLLRDFGSISRGHYLVVSRLNRDISEQDFATRVSDVVRSALDTYWDLVFQSQDVRVKEEGVNLAQLVLEQNRAQLDAGTLAPLDVTQAEAEVASRTEELIAARYAKRITESQLKKLISSRPDPGVIGAEITPISQPPATPRAAVDLAQAIQRAQETSPEVRRALIDLDSRKVEVDFTRNQLRPSLDVAAGYTQAGLGGIRVFRDYSADFLNPPIFLEQPGGYRDSLDALFRGRYFGYYGTVNLKVSIGNDDARATNAQVRIAMAQAEERLRGVRQTIAFQIRDAAERMERDRARIQSAQVTVRFNEQRLAGEQEKAAQGESVTRFVLESQRDLAEARSRLARAQSDAVKSQVAFDRAVGDLLTSQGIQVKQQLPLK